MRAWVLNVLTSLAALASGAVIGGAAITAAAVTGTQVGVYRNSDLSTRNIVLAPMIVAAIAVMTLLPRRLAGAAAAAGGATIWVLAATAERSVLASGTATFVLWTIAIGALAGGSITSLTGSRDLPAWVPMTLLGWASRSSRTWAGCWYTVGRRRRWRAYRSGRSPSSQSLSPRRP